MRNFVMFAAFIIAALFTSCNDDFESTSSDKPASAEARELTLSLSGDFAYTLSTRATTTKADTPKDLYVFDYDMSGKQLQSFHLTGENDDKIHPRIKLQEGAHKLYIVLSYGDRPYSSPYDTTIDWVKIGDTFWKAYDIFVDSKTPSTIDITLERVVTMLQITSLDKVPEGAKSITATPKNWYYGFDYITGKACEGSNVSHSLLWTVPSNWEYANLQAYSFASEDFSTEVKFESVLADGSKVKTTASNVPFRKNQITSMKGYIFEKNDGGSGTGGTVLDGYGFNIKVDDTWYKINEMTW